MLDELFASNTPFDWDQFLVGDVDQAGDASAAPADADTSPASAVLTLSNAASPASDVNGASPKSTESESSQSLEVSKGLNLFDFDFDLPAATGIAHDPSDIMATLAPPATTAAALTTDPTLPSDPTVLSTFGSSFANFGSLASLGSNAVSQLQLGNLLSQLTGSAPAQPAPAPAPSLPEAYAALGWPLTTESTNASTASPAPSMKRKLSEMSDDQSAKRARGRVGSSGGTPIAKRPYRRQSKNGLSLSQLAAAAASGSPVVVPTAIKVETPAADEDEDEEPVKLTASGKLSTARPKAVVPEKYMKNGEAQAITGMTTEEIMAFPNWAALMACVDDAHRAGAEVFGKMITENRDKAKWAAKKSRDERKAKVESLEGQVDELQSQIADLRGLLLGLVGRGLVPLSEVESYI